MANGAIYGTGCPHWMHRKVQNRCVAVLHCHKEVFWQAMARLILRGWCIFESFLSPWMVHIRIISSPNLLLNGSAEVQLMVAVRGNRRLFVHRVLASMGVISTMRVHLHTLDDPMMLRLRWDDESYGFALFVYQWPLSISAHRIIGDYLWLQNGRVLGACIERKTVRDLVGRSSRGDHLRHIVLPSFGTILLNLPSFGTIVFNYRPSKLDCLCRRAR